MTLEESLRDLCEKHGLDSIRLDFNRFVRSGHQFSASAFWDLGKGTCKVVNGDADTFSEAVKISLENVNAVRAVPVVVDLPTGPIVVEA